MAENLSDKVKDRLRKIRKKRGLTQKQLADAMFCNQSRIAKIENKRYQDITLGDLEAFSKVYKKPVAFFLSDFI